MRQKQRILYLNVQYYIGVDIKLFLFTLIYLLQCKKYSFQKIKFINFFTKSTEHQ